MKDLSKLVAKQYVHNLAKPFPLSEPLKKVLDVLKQPGGLPILVGGCVRDHLLGHLAKDIDIEVYGLNKAKLEDVLFKHFQVFAVGKTFGIYKVVVDGEHCETFDVALPRIENKAGVGHKGFVVETNHALSFSEASARRDFTINAMGIEPFEQLLLDPHNGQHDLKEKRLVHVSQAFAEDPLRVLRAAQFVARFDLTLAKETLELCQKLEYELLSLSEERIYGEMKKLFFSKKPSLGFRLLRDARALILFPELAALIDCPQDPGWHPEGDVWIHTLMVVDEAAQIIAKNSLNEDDALIVMAGSLCHDFGKPLTTLLEEGRIKSKGHDVAGEAPTQSFLKRMGFPARLTETVVSMVREHLKPYQLYDKRDEVSDGAIRRLSARVNISLLVLVSQADYFGRTTEEAKSGTDPSADWLLKKAQSLSVAQKAPAPLLLGRHLLAQGLKPGPMMGIILSEAFECQLNGDFDTLDGALQWLNDYLKKSNKNE